jgi:PAS domain S-box-containing protein
MDLETAQSVLENLEAAQAEEVLQTLAQVFLDPSGPRASIDLSSEDSNIEAQYRTLVEQIPAVVFMIYLDRGVGEAYVSPHIESLLGFSRAEWLEDPIRWYERIHPDDKTRWSSEAAHMFLSGQPLHSIYRVLARDNRVVSFHCDAKMVRRSDGRPWFIHGVAFDITDLKRAEAALQEERNFASAVLDTVGALVAVLDLAGRFIRFNRACERTTGYAATEVIGRHVADLFLVPEDIPRFYQIFDQLRAGQLPPTFESIWTTRGLERRVIAWSCTVLTGLKGAVEFIIITGIDVTESNRLERTVLEISGREQRRIGRDLHDGLGQHLTGVAFMSKVLQRKLREKSSDEADDAAKIVDLVNQAINKTRELSKVLLPVLSDSRGLMSSLLRLATEVEDLYQVPCHFECEGVILINQSEISTHLYHIAQEAVGNSLRHAQPQRIVIRLEGGIAPMLSVEDDGGGIQQKWPPAPGAVGMGLQIMSYRAKMIGGTLDVRQGSGGGTTVSCTFPCSVLESEE